VHLDQLKMSVQLTTSDHVLLEVERKVAERSTLIKDLLRDLGDIAEPIPIPNVHPTFSTAGNTFDTERVNEAVMKKVIEKCDHHKNDTPATENDEIKSRKTLTDIDEWEQKFMDVDQEMLFDIVLVCH
jgi:S-phase kinase-associated protein 1